MRVSLFATCLVDAIFADVGVSTVRLLRRLGVDVDFPPDQTCCGQPAFNSGHHDAARQAAWQMVQAFEHSEYVVAPSGSCVSMVRHYYPRLFQGRPEEEAAVAFAQKCFELSQFIVDVLGVQNLGGRYDAVATYHPSCHMTRGLGVRSAPLALLSHIDGLELVPLPMAEECCGFGGTFAVKMADLSVAMADDKVANVVKSGAHVLIGGDAACLMHVRGRMLRQGVDVKVMHLATLLEEATRPTASTKGGGAA